MVNTVDDSISVNDKVVIEFESGISICGTITFISHYRDAFEVFIPQDPKYRRFVMLSFKGVKSISKA